MTRAGRETWVVLGASSTIARAFADAAAAEGADLILAGRDRADLEASAADLAIRHGVEAQAIDFDALNMGAHEEFVAACRERARGTLHVFLAFALMPEQADIDREFDLARRTIETTFLGAVSVLSRFAPILEAAGRGHVVALGSVAGDRGRPGNTVYGSAKAGLHVYLQGLRARLARAGVTVTTVKPGFIDTPMTWGRPGLFLLASPEACARASLRHARRGTGEVYFPWFWRWIMLAIRLIPDRIFNRLDF